MNAAPATQGLHHEVRGEERRLPEVTALGLAEEERRVDGRDHGERQRSRRSSSRGGSRRWKPRSTWTPSSRP